MQTVDLTNCADEPIHIPGSIQPHGVLIVLDQHGRIIRASLSIERLLGVSHSEALGKTLPDVLAGGDADEISQLLIRPDIQSRPVNVQSVHSRSGQLFDAIAHRVDGQTILELEPRQSEKSDFLLDNRLLQNGLVRFRGARSLQELFEIVVDKVRKITGFDRVMLYRFDSDWNGKIVAEAKTAELESFLGLHYPASDIPEQARRLYTINWLRFIATRDYEPSLVLPAADPKTGKPLDMSFCVLRSVSPIHLQYLRNMGVNASMSISLVHHGKLWGLIACHHNSPKIVPYDARAACELIGQVLSYQAAWFETEDTANHAAARTKSIEQLVTQLDPGDNFGPSLTEDSGLLIDLVDAGGAAVVDDEQIDRIGQTPSDEVVLDILARLVPKAVDGMVTTDHLASVIGKTTYDSVASGVMAIRVTPESRRWIVWFRPEQIRVVNWAGDPAKSVTKSESGDVRLSPRGSFSLWKQTVHGRSLPWTASDQQVAREFHAAMLAKILNFIEQLAADNRLLRHKGDERERHLSTERAARQEAERMNQLKDDFVATLSHELRTPLTAILGWSQILRDIPALEEDLREGVEIIERNARVQSQLVEDLLDISRIASGKLRLDVQPVSLPPVLEAALQSVRPAADAKEIKIYTFIDPMPGVTVSGDPQRLQQIIWNLFNNAIKFTPKGGRVRVELKRVDSHVELEVNDNGMGIEADFLPHVFDRFRQADASSNRRHAGLGLGLAIVRNLVELHGGTIWAGSQGPGKGATFTVSLPVRPINVRPSGAHPVTPGDVLSGDGPQLTGVSVLVVDDEPDVRNLVGRILRNAGATVELAGSAPEAMDKMRAQRFAVLISDIGMPLIDGYKLIASIRQFENESQTPKTPAIALTAYARPEDRQRVMLAGFQVHLAKPVASSELVAVVANVAGRV